MGNFRMLIWLDPNNDHQPFPDPEQALIQPNGLVAAGGNLSPRRLLQAYQMGIFPWYSPGEPILWWSPDPRTVLFPDRIKISRSLRKTIKKALFTVTMDRVFGRVIQCCAAPRQTGTGTWITTEMQQAYLRLHRFGYAHSVETWQNDELVGGLYGVAIGRVFYGESMFSRVSDASKVALVALTKQLQQWQFAVIDCQMHTEHLMSLGAQDISRTDFLNLLRVHCGQESRVGLWQFEVEPWPPYSSELI